MARERRNYYRILHVQPEAPAEVITAVYRCLMTKLRHHPDLGGDHETAAHINQAYAVLSDPDKRSTYDRSRQRRRPQVGESFEASGALRACPFCGYPIPRQVSGQTRCRRCQSPLAPIAHNMSATRELFGRRSAPRVDKSWRVTVHTEPSAAPAVAVLRDLSVTGVSLFTAAAVRVGANIRIEAAGMDAVAHVIKVQPREKTYLVRAFLLTALFSSRSGVFMSETA